MNRYRVEVVFMGFFLLAAGIYYAPLLLHINLHFASLPLGDKGTNLWNLWWVYYALFEQGTSPLWCDWLYYPWGIDLRHHTLSLTNGVLAAPITALWGPNIAYNTLFFAWTALTGFFAGLWAWRLGVSVWAAAWVGLIAAFGDYRGNHHIHLNLFSTHWLFLAFWWLEHCLARPQSRRWLLLGSLWVLAAFSSFYYALFIGIYWVLRLLVHYHAMHYGKPSNISQASAVPPKPAPLRKSAILPPLMVVVCLLAYFYIPPMPRRITPDPVPLQVSVFWSLDAAHWLLPAEALNAIWPGAVEDAPEFQLHPGLFVAALFLFAMARYGKKIWKQEHGRFAIIAMIVFMLLALGPVFKWMGRPLSLFGAPLFLPGVVFEFIPKLDSLRVYTRFAYIGFMLFTLIAAYGLDTLLRLRSANAGKAVLISALFIGHYVFWLIDEPGIKLYRYTPPDYVKHSVTGPVLEVPYTPTTLSGMHLYHQTIHHQPLFVVEFSRLQNYRQRYTSTFSTLALLNSYQPSQRLTDQVREDLCQILNELNVKNLWQTKPPKLANNPPSTVISPFKAQGEVIELCSE